MPLLNFDRYKSSVRALLFVSLRLGLLVAAVDVAERMEYNNN